jgi:hypothetical protein
MGGWSSSPKALGSTRTESLLEGDAHTLISVDPKVRSFAVQAHRLTYWAPAPDGSAMARQYVPDIVMQTTGGVVVLEVKASRFAEDRRWRELEPFIRQAYRDDHNADFVVLTEAVLRVQPRLSNCQIMLSHARDDDAAAETAVQRALAPGAGATSLEGLAATLEREGITYQRVFGAVMRHCIRGAAVIDLSEPIGPMTVVRAAS